MITTEVYTTDDTNEPNLVLIIVPSAVAVVLIVISVVIACIAKRRRKPVSNTLKINDFVNILHYLQPFLLTFWDNFLSGILMIKKRLL